MALKTVEFKPVAGGGYRCSNCQLYLTHVPHYCPSCALPTDNPDDNVECDARAKAEYFSVGGSDF